MAGPFVEGYGVAGPAFVKATAWQGRERRAGIRCRFLLRNHEPLTDNRSGDAATSITALLSCLPVATAQEKSEQNRAQHRDHDRTKTPGSRRKEPKHARRLDAPRRRASIPALATEIPVDEFTRDGDCDDAKDPAKHVALRSASERRRDV